MDNGKGDWFIAEKECGERESEEKRERADLAAMLTFFFPSIILNAEWVGFENIWHY